MPLDILGRTRATMACAESLFEVHVRENVRLVLVPSRVLVSADK